MTRDRWQLLVGELVGKPFKWGARGPDEYDCWGIVLEVFKAMNRTMPGYWQEGEDRSAENEEKACAAMQQEFANANLWIAVKARNTMPGDVVALSTGKTFHHVAVLTPFGMLHASASHGVRIVKTESLMRLQGYQRIEYFRWLG